MENKRLSCKAVQNQHGYVRFDYNNVNTWPALDDLQYLSAWRMPAILVGSRLFQLGPRHSRFIALAVVGVIKTMLHFKLSILLTCLTCLDGLKKQ